MNARWTRRLAAMLLASGAAFLAATPAAHAQVQVSYSTSGTFAASGTDQYLLTYDSNPGDYVTITYNQASGSVTTPSFANFGSFTINSPSSDTTKVAVGMASNKDFTMTITQTVPGPGGGVTYTANLAGQLDYDSSGAFIRFAQPLTQGVPFANGVVTYRILNADVNANGDPVAGRINLPAPSTGPGGQNSNVTVNGYINAVPEPATLGSALAAVPMIGLAAWARRRKAAA